MTKYYCPYCSSRYQIHKRRVDGVMICGQCGDPLLKKLYLKPIQIVAFLAATSFIAPFLFMVFSSYKELIRYRPQQRNSEMSRIF